MILEGDFVGDGLVAIVNGVGLVTNYYVPGLEDLKDGLFPKLLDTEGVNLCTSVIGTGDLIKSLALRTAGLTSDLLNLRRVFLNSVTLPSSKRIARPNEPELDRGIELKS